MTPVTSQFVWQCVIEKSHEVLLIMKSDASKFKEIEHEVRIHHCYSTFVLTMSEVACVLNNVKEWVQETLNQK